MASIQIIQGDITTLQVDAIVNAANKSLLGGGGVDGAIHFAAGPALLEECRSLGGCLKGEAKLTRGHNLPAKFIIHTVGPEHGYEEGREAELLKQCYENVLGIARDNGLRTVAFPSISTGAFGYPKDEAAKIAIDTVRQYVSAHPDAFDEIFFVCFSEFDTLIYQSIFDSGSFAFDA